MYKYVLAASVIAVVEAQYCPLLSHSVGSCGPGQTLADLYMLTACKDYICQHLMGVYTVAHGADKTKKLAGQAYGCQIEEWDGTDVGDVICMPTSMPTPPPPSPSPAPTPPSPTQCNTLVYSRKSCPPGGNIVDLATLTRCKDFLCTDRMGPYDYAHGSNKTKLLAGQGYGCELKAWNGEGQDGLICSMSAPTNCAALKNVTGSCPVGMAPVSTEVLETCSGYLCENVLGQFRLAHGADSTKVLVGQEAGCTIKTSQQGPVGYTICGAGN